MAQAGTTQLHTKQHLRVLHSLILGQLLASPSPPPFLVFPLLPAFPPPLSRSPLLCPRTVTGHSEVTLKLLSVTLRAENSLCSLERSSRNVGDGRETDTFLSRLLKTWSLSKAFSGFRHPPGLVLGYSAFK